MLSKIKQEINWWAGFIKALINSPQKAEKKLTKTLWPNFIKQTSMITYTKMLPGRVYIWTDGSCKSDFSGGWSFVVVKDNKIINRGSGHRRNTESNAMELTAVLEALKATTGKITIVTDSAYVACGLRNYFVNGIKVDRDLWKQVFALATENTRDIDALWCKGHSGLFFNEECDRLAQSETDKIFTGVKRKRRRDKK